MIADYRSGAGITACVDPWGLDLAQLTEVVDALVVAGFAISEISVLAEAGTQPAVEQLVTSTGITTVQRTSTSLNVWLAEVATQVICMIRGGRVERDFRTAALSFFDRFPDTEVLYADSLSSVATISRPQFSHVRLLGHDYLGPVVVMQTETVRQLGGFADVGCGAELFDLVLRASDAGRVIRIDPKVYATELALHADASVGDYAVGEVVRAYLERQHIAAVVEPIGPNLRNIQFQVAGDPLVSILIPTRGGSAEIGGEDRVLVVEAVRGIIERSTYTHVEFVIIADAETPDSVIEQLEALCGSRLRLVLWDAEFNFSAKMNRGATVARGDYLLLLNDDVEVVSPGWIEAMLGLAQLPSVGMVGAELYFEDSTLQHAGQVYTGGVAGHAAFGWNGGRDDALGTLKVDHEVSGVTAACALISRDLYFEVGGFTPELPGNYNDVDLNLKVRESGRSAVLAMGAKLYHFESKSRDPQVLESDLATLQGRWASRMQTELYSRMLM